MKTNKTRRGLALVLGLVFAGMTLVGCGAKSQIDETAIVATLGEQEISLKEANFWAKYQEAITNTNFKYYYSILLSNGYSEDEAAATALNYGGDLEDVVDNVMESLETFYVMKNHAEDYGVSITAEDEARISEAADQFLKDNSKSIEVLMSADKDLLVDVLKTYTIYLRMIPFMEAEGLNEEISEEESLMKTYSYIYVSLESTVNEEGETVEYTETEKIQTGNALQEFVNEFRENGGTDFDTAATEEGYSVSEHSYSPTDEEDTLVDLNKVAEGLKVGDVSDVIELTDEEGVITGVAILRLDTDKDLEAIEEQKELILSERKAECFEKVLDGWKAEAEFKVNDEVLETITVEDHLVQYIAED